MGESILKLDLALADIFGCLKRRMQFASATDRASLKSFGKVCGVSCSQTMERLCAAHTHILRQFSDPVINALVDDAFAFFKLSDLCKLGL
ncbi:hypothetical protein WI81_17130 [Burkholderia ubonensis]|nr:hypothetical protein WI81_17130 [Burkholderia ubonensis]